MPYYDSEKLEKAKSWNVPLETPRMISGNFSVFKASPGLSIVGIVFVPLGILMGILFYSLGIMNDFLVDDWIKTNARPIRWINSTGERVNNRYIPGIEVEYTANDGRPKVSVAKITKLDKVNQYKRICDNGTELSIEYSEKRPRVVKIEGMSASAMPDIIVLFPVIFFCLGVFLIIAAHKMRSKIRFILENGEFAVGKILKKKKSTKSKSRRKSTNQAIIIIYEYSVDSEKINGKANVSIKVSESINVDQEIPVIYTSFNLKYKQYSPLLLGVEFNKRL